MEPNTFKPKLEKQKKSGNGNPKKFFIFQETENLKSLYFRKCNF